MSISRTEGVLQAILAVTPAEEHDAVCAAWEGLLPERREYLSRWSPAFIAGWLRGLVSEWDDTAPVNVLPEGGYARKVAIVTADGERQWVWCRVPTTQATSGEVIHCDDKRRFALSSRIRFTLRSDGFAAAAAASF
jgi:hypothetical protein